MNVFESAEQKMIPATLIYGLREKQGRKEVLMMHRLVKRRDGSADFHGGKWNGLGGKFELNESALEAAVREFQEESGSLIDKKYFQFHGTVHFPNFKPHKNEDWICSLFTVMLPDDFEIAACEEGELSFVPLEEVLSLSLWEGDVHFLPTVLEGKTCFGTIWYEDGKVVKKEFLELK